MGYEHLVQGGNHTITLDLSKEDEAVILKAYDHGIESLTQDEMDLLRRAVICDLKNSIYP